VGFAARGTTARPAGEPLSRGSGGLPRRARCRHLRSGVANQPEGRGKLTQPRPPCLERHTSVRKQGACWRLNILKERRVARGGADGI